jgi:hypothetical protein
MFRRILFRAHDFIASSIVDKLVALGWGDENNKIPKSYALTTHKLVNVPQLLTKRSKLHLH